MTDKHLDSSHPALPDAPFSHSRRGFLKRVGVVSGVAAAASMPAIGQAAWGGHTLSDAFSDFFQRHYQRMSSDEINASIERIIRRTKRLYDVEIECEDSRPIPNVVFGYALNISKCKGYRKCVTGCVAENNMGRESQTEYIRVLQMKRGTIDLEHSDHYYNPEQVPVPGMQYMPVQCQQCEDPPCVKACPVKATWMEPDGIVVVDYNWCIGCRYCMASCPYFARRFNWSLPQIPADKMNTFTSYLGNRPRPRGVVEKCHFCTQRTRNGRLPACHQACPTGARVFGNLLDPHSEIRYVLEHKTVFRLKEDLGTEPKFWYYTDV